MDRDAAFFSAKHPNPLHNVYQKWQASCRDLQLLYIKQVLLKSRVLQYPWALIDTINMLDAKATSHLYSVLHEVYQW